MEQVGHLFLFSGGIDATSRNLCSALMVAVFRVMEGVVLRNDKYTTQHNTTSEV